MSLQSTDQIADLLTRIRNAILVGKNEISIPSSKLKLAIVETLKKSGYIADCKIEESTPRNNLVITIAEEGKAPKINEISKVSKPGRRVYVNSSEIPKVKSGRGIVLISTSKGVMSGQEATKNHLGGEVLVRVW